MLSDCKQNRVCMIYILDSYKGYWKKRSIFLNMDADNFERLFYDICSNNFVLLNFKDSLEVNYDASKV